MWSRFKGWQHAKVMQIRIRSDPGAFRGSVSFFFKVGSGSTPPGPGFLHIILVTIGPTWKLSKWTVLFIFIIINIKLTILGIYAQFDFHDSLITIFHDDNFLFRSLMKRLSKSATDLSSCKKKTRSNSDEEFNQVGNGLYFLSLLEYTIWPGKQIEGVFSILLISIGINYFISKPIKRVLSISCLYWYKLFYQKTDWRSLPYTL